MEPKYKKDILEQLRHVDGTAAAVNQARECLNDCSMTLMRAADEIEKLRKALDCACGYLADLNGSDWIHGDGPGERDMRQRAEAIHARVSDVLFRSA